MYVVLQITILLMLLLIAQAILRRASRWVLLTLFGVAPMALTPYWVQQNSFGPFIWIKGYSVAFFLCWLALMRGTTLGTRRWARASFPLLLAVNILEAMAVDWLEGETLHVFNGIAGLLLIASLPHGWRATRFTTNKPQDLQCGTNRSWIVGYTLWNWAFVVLNYPAYTGYHTAVLLAALIVGWREPQRWLQTRAATLGVILFGLVTWNSELVAWFDTTHWANVRVTNAAAIIAWAYMVGHVVVMLLARRQHTPPPSVNHLSAATVGRHAY